MGSTSPQRHQWRLLRLSFLSALLAILVSFLDRLRLVPSALDAPLALVPILPLVGFFVGLMDWLESLDELQRRIHLEALLLQFAATGILVMGYGMLARIGTVPNYPVTKVFPWLWVAMFVCWAIGIAAVRRKYE